MTVVFGDGGLRVAEGQSTFGQYRVNKETPPSFFAGFRFILPIGPPTLQGLA